jgi:hypothetical protein
LSETSIAAKHAAPGSQEAGRAAGKLAARTFKKKEAAAAAAVADAQEQEGVAGPVSESFHREEVAAAARDEYPRHRPGPVTESAGTSGEGARVGGERGGSAAGGGAAAAAVAAVAAANLGPGKGAFSGRRIHYFLDVFAVRQLYSTESYGVHTHHDVPDNQFPFVVRKAQVFAIACYPWFDPGALTRSWCMNELAHAIKYGKPVEVMFGERFYDIAEGTSMRRHGEASPSPQPPNRRDCREGVGSQTRGGSTSC